MAADLAAISWFFIAPYSRVVGSLNAVAQSWVLAEASRNLAYTGRFREARSGLRAASRMAEDASDWHNAASFAVYLSNTELALGEIGAATTTAHSAVGLANRAADAFQIETSRRALAAIQATAGRIAGAEALFADTEARQNALQMQNPLLHSSRSYQYCDLILLHQGAFTDVRDRAAQTLAWAIRMNWRLEIGLNTLLLARAHLGLGLSARAVRRDLSRRAAHGIDDAVAELVDAGHLDQNIRGYLARAALRRSLADWPGAARDLDEVEEIAEPGPMKLFLCDMALERARLALWRYHGFAPLAGLLNGRPEIATPEPSPARLDDARRQLAIAGEYVQTCGYHRRDEELAELEAVVKGERIPADLPPRV